MAEVCGKLRSDLDIHVEPGSSPEVSSGVIVKDPITHSFYRFSPVQASVLRLLDGRLELSRIAEIVSGKHQTEVLVSQLEDFMGKLQSLLLLDNAYCWAKLEAQSKSRRRSIRNLLSIKFFAFNPTPFSAASEKTADLFRSGIRSLCRASAFIALILTCPTGNRC